MNLPAPIAHRLTRWGQPLDDAPMPRDVEPWLARLPGEAYVRLARHVARAAGREDVADLHGSVLWAAHRIGVAPRRLLVDAPAPLPAYIDDARLRPATPGSSYNQPPQVILAAWLSHVPAWVVAWGGWEYPRPRPYTPALARRCVAVAIARRRTTGHAGDAWRLTRGAARRLGRLSPEAQRLVIEATIAAHPEWPHAISARMLAWDAAAPAIRTMRADPSGRYRAAVATGKRRAQLLDGRPLCPAYPAAPEALQARITRGERPVDLAPGLTAREAHAWLRGSAPAVAPWLLRRLVPAWAHVAVRDVAVVRWLAAVHGDRDRRHAITRPQEGGRTLLEVVDEVEPCDIHGLGDSVRAVYARAATRAAEAVLQGAIKADLRGPRMPWALRFPRAVRQLRTAEDLAVEGREMHHCVATYWPYVQHGERSILALRAGAHRSTVELDRFGSVVQHRGPRNGAPAPCLERLLNRWLRANNLEGTW